MRGFNKKEQLLRRDLKDVLPARFNLIVRIHDEAPRSGKIVLPQTAYDLQDTTTAHHGTIEAMGTLVPDSQSAEGVLEVGDHVIFDESVSVDDPNRCFKWGEDTFILFDVETILAVMWPIGEQPIDIMLDTIGRHKLHLMRDLVLLERTENKDKLRRGVWIPANTKKPCVGGTVVAAGLGAFGSQGQRLPVGFTPGDNVLFPKYGATDVTIFGKKYGLLPQNKILATVHGELEEGEDFDERPVEDTRSHAGAEDFGAGTAEYAGVESVEAVAA